MCLRYQLVFSSDRDVLTVHTGLFALNLHSIMHDANEERHLHVGPILTLSLDLVQNSVVFRKVYIYNNPMFSLRSAQYQRLEELFLSGLPNGNELVHSVVA